MASSSFRLSQLAIPSVCILISFLAYSSQYFFLYFEPAPLRDTELWRLNIFALCIWICYYRTCTVDPGRIPKDWKPLDSKQLEADRASGRQRWCRKCEAYKPPRAHHCRTCQRCIPKMDHHCPWTSNCVSHFTFPHFVRFLFYAVTGMSYLETLLYERASIIWASRNRPSYLGPSALQMGHLFVLLVVNSFTVFFLMILLGRTIWSMSINTTTIEEWEIERHQTLVRRSRHFGGYLTGPGGVRIRIRKQEFPYDIGIWSNIKAGMGGTANVLSWFWPLARTPDRRTGLEFEVNDFEDPDVTWSPPDPDRIPVTARAAMDDVEPRTPSIYESAGGMPIEGPKATLRASQDIRRRKRFHDRAQEELNQSASSRESSPGYSSEPEDGEEGWKNSEGERLRDFGVEEDIEFYDEEDIPLAILMQQKAQQK
ncbi:DHHC palmitoyltransferase-domain-containing protein [Aspergillus welwitschiae]|uniref:Palmitoyltransferase PFA4 n=1 Tax=Aspergillus welwitschiae TaxID=1341132 RepID=A0A3F3QEZ6_9EURO|nr:DHHC palmitoyltransferase-domain-containing protein [Aspergillus welwitschiae]RDH37697.1 DHHC palmitoyltransferase-domain-containing protein [Aspergillus welwitschiae]